MSNNPAWPFGVAHPNATTLPANQPSQLIRDPGAHPQGYLLDDSGCGSGDGTGFSAADLNLLISAMALVVQRAGIDQSVAEADPCLALVSAVQALGAPNETFGSQVPDPNTARCGDVHWNLGRQYRNSQDGAGNKQYIQTSGPCVVPNGNGVVLPGPGFPENPDDGDIFAPGGNQTWTYDAALNAWNAVCGNAIGELCDLPELTTAEQQAFDGTETQILCTNFGLRQARLVSAGITQPSGTFCVTSGQLLPGLIIPDNGGRYVHVSGSGTYSEYRAGGCAGGDTTGVQGRAEAQINVVLDTFRLYNPGDVFGTPTGGNISPVSVPPWRAGCLGTGGSVGCTSQEREGGASCEWTCTSTASYIVRIGTV